MKLLISFLLMVAVPATVFSHSINQVSYNFDSVNNENTLTIHFTTAGAIGLIKTIKPELKKTSVIRLKDYTSEFTDYFNETINLTVNGKKVNFVYFYQDLLNHDAKLVFKLTRNLQNAENIKIKITSFLPLYKKMKNFVKITINENLQSVTLTKQKTEHSFYFEKSIKSTWVWQKNYTYIFLGLFIFILAVYFLFKE